MTAQPAPDRTSDPSRDARSVLSSVFGLSGFRGAQEKIVRHVTAGGNCLVLMPTGGGKSLCYQLPSLLRDGCGIVVSPLIALMRDQVAGLTEAGVNAAVLNSTLSYEEASEVERRLIAGDLDFGLANRQLGDTQFVTHILEFQTQLVEPHLRRVMLTDDEMEQLVAATRLLNLSDCVGDVHASVSELAAPASW